MRRVPEFLITLEAAHSDVKPDEQQKRMRRHLSETRRSRSFRKFEKEIGSLLGFEVR